jgi:hypothetical protein
VPALGAAPSPHHGTTDLLPCRAAVGLKGNGLPRVGVGVGVVRRRRRRRECGRWRVRAGARILTCVCFNLTFQSEDELAAIAAGMGSEEETGAAAGRDAAVSAR